MHNYNVHSITSSAFIARTVIPVIILLGTALNGEIELKKL